MKHYRIHMAGQQSGPFIIDQLRSMWQVGSVTAAATYWTSGMKTWNPIHELQLGGQARSTPPQHVVTSARGTGVVAAGVIICLIGGIALMAGSVGPVYAITGVALLFVGFFVAFLGRLMS